MPTKEIPVVWIQGAGCSGCSVSILNATDPHIQNVLVDEVVPGQHVNLRFHPTVMAGQGDPAIEVLRGTPGELPKGYVLIVEGAIPTADGGVFCVVGEEGEHPALPGDDEAAWAALQEILELDIANLTPVQALVALNDLQQRLRGDEDHG